MTIKTYVTRLWAPTAICVALIVLPLVPIAVPVSIAGATGTSSISGTVTDALDPSGLLGVCVNVLLQGGASAGTATTAADGSYEVANLAAGIYDVEFDPTCDATVTSPDVAQYYNDVYSNTTETAITVGTGDAVTDIGATLDVAGTISGIVTDAADPTGLIGVCVKAVATTDTLSGGSGTAITAADGSYSITGLAPDSFQVSFDPTCNGADASPDVAQWYLDATTESTATPVEVTSGNTTSAIDASLQLSGSISGTVTDAADPTGLIGVCVKASSSTGGPGVGSAVSASDGTYSIAGLPADSYTVEFDPTCHGTITSPDVPQWYSAATMPVHATAAVVASGAVTSSVNAVLNLAGSISGTVTDAYHPSGLANICVSAVSSDGGTVNGTAVTSANGTYTITGLEADSYTVNFDPTCSGSLASYDIAQPYGSAVSASAGVVTPSINVVLATYPGLVTHIAVSSPANPGVEGNAIIFYATVTSSDNGGTVAFSDNGQPIGACAAQPITAGVASCSQTYAVTGSQEISATYSGDEGYASSISTDYNEIIDSNTPPPPPPTPPSPTSLKTTTDLTSSANSVISGNVTYTAVVSPTNNKGTISFFDASLPITGCQGVALTSGVATCLQVDPSPGSHPISASFSGSTGYDPSTSANLTEVVLQNTDTRILSNYNPAADKAAFHIVATTTPVVDGGTVQFEMNGAPISGCESLSLTNGVSTCKVKGLAPGSYSITAVYSGDTLYETSSSNTYTEKVLRSSQVTVGSSKDVAKKGKLIRFVGRVNVKYGTGFLTFSDGGRVIAGCKKVKLQSGVGECTVDDLPVGSHIISVAFSGNSRFGPSYNGLLEVIKK